MPGREAGLFVLHKIESKMYLHAEGFLWESPQGSFDFSPSIVEFLLNRRSL